MAVVTKISLSRDTLLKPLQLVIGVVERKQTLPILSHVLLKFNQNKLSVIGTDLEVELIGHAILEKACDEPLDITVPGRKLLDICRALPDGSPIELHVEETRVVLKAIRSKFVLSSLPASEFPNIENPDQQLQFSIPQQNLLGLLQQTYFSMAQQDVRYYLNGMLFEATEKSLRTVATDGHRLATTHCDADIQLDHRLQIIMPRKGILELMRLLSDDEAGVKINIGNNHIQATTDEFTLTSKLVEGRFPDYQRVIPKRGARCVQLVRSELKQSLNRVAILCNEKFHGIHFDLANNVLKIQANNPEQEMAEEELAVKYTEEAIEIGFNVNYVLDILNTIETEHLMMYFGEANNSVLLVPENEESHSLYVIMPMRL